MTRFIDVGQEAEGVIAIGQIATGVIAIGQMATGVIAIGQVARGVVAVGMGSFGFVAVGMGAVSVFHTTAMLGTGASGLGLVVPLVPRWPDKIIVPTTTTWSALQDHGGQGWLPVAVARDENGPALTHHGQPLPLRYSRAVWATLNQTVTAHPARLVGWVERQGDEWVCTRLMAVPLRAHRHGRFWVGMAAGSATLALVCALFWAGVALPLVRFLAGL